MFTEPPARYLGLVSSAERYIARTFALRMPRIFADLQPLISACGEERSASKRRNFRPANGASSVSLRRKITPSKSPRNRPRVANFTENLGRISELSLSLLPFKYHQGASRKRAGSGGPRDAEGAI